MGKVIQLHEAVKLDEKYAERLGDLVDHLEASIDDLTTDVVNLAMVGPWREWDDDQAIGAIANIDLAALGDTKDLKVTVMAHLLMDMTKVLKMLRAPVLKSQQ